MKSLKTILLPVTIAIALSMVCVFTLLSTSCKPTEPVTENKPSSQLINLAVSHGHCSSKFSGQVENFNLELFPRTDLGNPLEDMKISFDIDPNTLNACNDSSLSEKLKSPGFFMNKEEDKITFKTTQVYTLGIDWYQINGQLSIKGIEHNVILYATGIRGENEISPTELVLQGQVYLLDWGIDFDLFLFGTAQSPTSYLHLNMVIDLDK
jgi:polyisoprenoid-binding protein YceI